MFKISGVYQREMRGYLCKNGALVLKRPASVRDPNVLTVIIYSDFTVYFGRNRSFTDRKLADEKHDRVQEYIFEGDTVSFPV